MMTIAPGFPLPTAQLRLATALVKVPRVLIAAVLWLLLVEVVHGLAAWGVLALVVGGTVASVVAEPAMVRVLWWARRPSTPITVPEAPRVRVLITSRQAAAIGQAGRGHLVVPSAWVGRADLPALLRRARLRQVVSAGRFDVAYQWFTWPWQILGSFVDGIGSGASRLPLIGFAWRVRFVVAGIAVWQTVVAARYAATVGIVVVIGLTYLLPWTKAHQERLVRHAVVEAEEAAATRRTLQPSLPALPAPGRAGRTRSARESRGTRQPCGRRPLSARFAICVGGATRGWVWGRTATDRKGPRT